MIPFGRRAVTLPRLLHALRWASFAFVACSPVCGVPHSPPISPLTGSISLCDLHLHRTLLFLPFHLSPLLLCVALNRLSIASCVESHRGLCYVGSGFT
ncbi:hypothetical protein KC19_4G074600 [Ceratodon purpureus]|uniref:Secreted protein n=1 Tax=Ceratodon purpureus TaxID=3225 RepID=A0A8T0I831_CERPU|nr:hypothetical protein KC19_4G074600 [Ceratodon purpureus]